MKDFLEQFAQWWDSIGVIQRFLPTLLLLIIGLVVIRIVLRFVNRTLRRSKLEKAAHSLIRSVIKVVLYMLLGLMVASALGINVTGVVALASVASLAISLAVQDSLTNVVGGFTLIYTHPFASGDYVEIAGQAGTVQEIGIAYTKLSTPDGKMISIPNASVVAAEIVNYTVTGMRRLDIRISVDYGAPVEKVLAALHEAADVPGKLVEKGIFTEIMDYTDKGIECAVRIWTTGDDFWAVKFLVNRRIHEIFLREGLQINYPQLTVHNGK